MTAATHDVVGARDGRPSATPAIWQVRQAGPAVAFSTRWGSVDTAMSDVPGLLFTPQPWNLCGS